jgi:hypothetical protein
MPRVYCCCQSARRSRQVMREKRGTFSAPTRYAQLWMINDK